MVASQRSVCTIMAESYTSVEAQFRHDSFFARRLWLLGARYYRTAVVVSVRDPRCRIEILPTENGGKVVCGVAELGRSAPLTRFVTELIS